MRKSASFISIGRGEQFFERGTTYIKSQRAATAQQNLGPGSYNLAYTWSPDSNSSSRASPTCPDGACTSSSYRECCAGRLHPPGQYEKPWQNERSIAPIMTPRERQQGREHLSDSIDSVRHLPTY